MANCARCGGQMMAGGALYSPVRMAFRPSESKFLTFEMGDVMTKATMCRDCGVVEIVGDIAKLKRLLGEPVASPATVRPPVG